MLKIGATGILKLKEMAPLFIKERFDGKRVRIIASKDVKERTFYSGVLIEFSGAEETAATQTSNSAWFMEEEFISDRPTASEPAGEQTTLF